MPRRHSMSSTLQVPLPSTRSKLYIYIATNTTLSSSGVTFLEIHIVSLAPMLNNAWLQRNVIVRADEMYIRYIAFTRKIQNIAKLVQLCRRCDGDKGEAPCRAGLKRHVLPLKSRWVWQATSRMGVSTFSSTSSSISVTREVKVALDALRGDVANAFRRSTLVCVDNENDRALNLRNVKRHTILWSTTTRYLDWSESQ